MGIKKNKEMLLLNKKKQFFYQGRGHNWTFLGKYSHALKQKNIMEKFRAKLMSLIFLYNNKFSIQ